MNEIVLPVDEPTISDLVSFVKSIEGLFEQVTGPFDVGSADPPWAFKSYTKSKTLPTTKKLADYKTMTLKDIKALPVKDIFQKNSRFYLWVTAPMIKYGFEVLDAWGFSDSDYPPGIGFTWVKPTIGGIEAKKGNRQVGILSNEAWHLTNGHLTRGNPEYILCGVRGKGVPVLSKSVRNLIVAPRRKNGSGKIHSVKPFEAYDRIRQLHGPDMKYLEMFGREKRPGWRVVGDELTGNPMDIDLKLLKEEIENLKAA